MTEHLSGSDRLFLPVTLYPRSHCHCPPEGQWSHKVGYFSTPHSGNPRRLCTLNYYLTHKRKRQSGPRACRPLEKTPNVHVPSQGIASILNSSHQGQLQSGAKYNNSAWNCLWTQPVHWGKSHYIKLYLKHYLKLVLKATISLGLKH